MDDGRSRMMFDHKIALLLRGDLAPWKAINVAAFLVSGLAAQRPDVIGAPYLDESGRAYNALFAQPVIVLAGDGAQLETAHRRALDRGVRPSAFVDGMFSTGHDAANRAVFGAAPVDAATLVGLGVIAERRVVDKIVKGATMYA